MGRADYRGGKAPIKTADELASLLPIPLFLIVSGYAGPIYPKTDRSNPAPAVGIVAIKTLPDSLRPRVNQILPVWIHWTQWQSVVAPLLADERVTDWRGVLRDLGDLLDLLTDVYGPNGTIPYEAGTSVGSLRSSTRIPGGLYAPRCGDAQELVDQYGSLIQAQAVVAGY